MTISDERFLVIQAVAAGQLPTEAITDEEIVYMTESVFNTTLEQLSLNPALSVFWGEDQPTVH
jgi:hypothetical protein